MIEMASPAGVLLRRRGRRYPWRIAEIEELRHIHLGGVALGERRQGEARLDKLQNRRIIGDHM